MKKLIFPIGILFMLASCQNTTVEQDVQKYCDCVKNAQHDISKTQQCADIMNDIIVKYEYDPEASDKLQHLVNECK